MRISALALSFSLLAVPAFAQGNSTAGTVTQTAPANTAESTTTTTTATPAGTTTTTTHQHMSAQQRFEAANTTHDGHLTKQQAEDGHMKYVADHFDAIDSDHKGYVTQDEIKTYRHAQRAARKAAKAKSAG